MTDPAGAQPSSRPPTGGSGAPLAVVAVGGNALVGHDAGDGWAGQQAAVGRVAVQLAAVVADGWRLVVVHGNGPQVGLTLRRAELATPELPALPMDHATAETQGSLGLQFQRALQTPVAGAHAAAPGCVSVVTQVEVDAADPAFDTPTKPIGFALDEERARRLADLHGWQIAATDAGWRRVVPSPEPREILELDAVRALVDAGQVVVACGGGGVPVVRTADGGLRGVEAVVDKDRTAALLARRLGAEALLIGTDVAQVALDHGRPTQRWLGAIGADELRDHHAAGQFPAGSMGPKVEAVLDHLDAGGARATITDLDHLAAGLAGEAGTVVTPA